MIDTFSRDGLTFDVHDRGPADGEPVVLLHGFPQRASCWDAVAPLLHDAGCRTIAPDQRGYSPGARPWGRWHYRLPALVDDVAALVDLVGAPVHVVGHDWGAVVAWRLAETRPDLVRTLTAVSVPHPGAFLEACVQGPQLRRSWYVVPFNVPWLPELLVQRQPHRFDRALRAGGMTEADVARFRREIVEYGALPGALNWYRALPLAAPDMLPGPLGRRPRPVAVPTTHVWSDGDVALAREGAEACARWVDADYELVVLEGVSHWVPEHAPGPLAEAVLARVGSVDPSGGA